MLAEVKPLSYRERKMLDRARFLLISELSEASNKTPDKVEEQIDVALVASSGIKAKVDH
jgi:CarD family transcriptional regulator